MPFAHLHRPCVIADRLMPNGYPTAQRHRKALEAKLGRPLRDGYETHHRCENPGCIEPEHLEEREMREHRREHLLAHPRGQRTGPTTEEWRQRISDSLRGRPLSAAHRAALSAGQQARTDQRNRKLTDDQIREIRARLLDGPRGTAAVLAKEFGVSNSTIANVKYGRKKVYEGVV